MSFPQPVAFFVDESGRDAAPAGGRVFEGWIFVPGSPDSVTVRVRCGRRILLAWSGLPRPDVAAAHPTEAAAAFSGFRAELAADNPDAVRLEWCDAADHWREFWREPAAEGRHERFFFRPELPDHRLPLLLDGAAAAVAARSLRAAWPRVRRLLEEMTTPFAAWPASAVGPACLDEPAGETVVGDFVPVSGWVFAQHGMIRRVFARVGRDASVHLVYPRARPDVVAAFPGTPVPSACGFTGLIRLPADGPAWFLLQIYAEMTDGSVALVFTQRLFRTRTASQVRPGVRAALLVAALALRGAYRPQTWPAWWRELRAAWCKEEPPPAAKPTEPVPAAWADEAATVAPAPGDPLISLLVPVYNPPARYLQAMIASVRAQQYPRWELCLADDASTEPHVRPLLEAAARADARIRPVFRAENGQIARATNTALESARGTFVALLDHDDLLSPDALRCVVEALRERPDADFLYTDRDKIDDAGRHFDVERRGAWNPAMALTHNYLHHLTVIRRQIVEQAGAFRAEYFGSQDLDLYLRCHELIPPDRIRHVPVVAYHWRAHPGSTASRGDQKDYMFASARRGIADALGRRGLRATPFLPDFAPVYGLNLHQLRWDPALLAENPVSLVFAVARPDGPWRESLAAVRRSVPARSVEIIVVTAGPLAGAEPGLTGPVTLLEAAPGTALPALFNRGATAARHALLLLMQPGLQPLAAGWLEDLVGWLSVPGVDAAGPKLIQADGRLASAGWTLDAVTGLPRPLLAGEAPDDLGHQFLLHAARDSLLLDGACVLTRTDRFRAGGGYAAGDFPAAFFAADYCLGLQARGGRVVFSPQAVLRWTDAEQGVGAAAGREAAVFRARYRDRDDPWIHPRFRGRPEPEAALPDNGVPRWMPGGTIDFAAGWFYLESPQAHETLAAGRQVLGGWCIARPGEVIADLRLSVGPRHCGLVYGHPRPDLAALMAVQEEFFPVGFDLELDLPPGRFALRFEARTAAGWQPVGRIEVTVTAEPSRAPSEIPPRVTATELAAAAVWLATRPGVTGPDAGEIPWRQAVRHPAHPFCGHLDEPGRLVDPVYGGAEVRGWLLHETQLIRRVVGSFDFAPGLRLPHQGDSSLIQADFRQYPGSSRCAISGFLPLPDRGRTVATLRLWAALDDGSWHLVYVQRCLLLPAQVAGGTVPTRRQCFAAAAALRWSLWRQGIPGPVWASLGALASGPRAGICAPALAEARWPAWVPRRAPTTPHVLLVTHNLNREGAPAFLLELAGHLRLHTAARLTVVSPSDGPLRREFERRGMTVRLVDRDPLWAARGAPTRRALASLRRALRAEEASLVVANTVESFWAVEAAHRVGRPSLFYIHEPGVLGRHYLGQVGAAALAEAAAAVRHATVVSFPGRAAADYYRGFSSGKNFVIQPGWTEVLRAGEPVGGEGRAALRARLGYGPEDRLVINVGTVCARKDQLAFVDAAGRLARGHPGLAASARFRIIGEHASDYGEMVVARAAQMAPADLAVLPATPRIADYFAAADLFVLCSHEEGFPRVLLEAMQHGLPIVSTAIHTIPEIVRDGKEALLVPPGDPGALAAAMRRLLDDAELARHLGGRARRRVESRYTAAVVVPGHLRTLTQLAPDLLADAPKNPRARSTEPAHTAS